MTRASDITNFTDHRQNLRSHLNRVKSTGRPLFVTTNGETEAVVLSAKAYDELMDRADQAGIQAMLSRSEADLKAGRSHDAKAARGALAAKHGLKPGR
jgi:prevent-host-death family protein